ncbi:MAG TPA: iron ABC transporter permease [Propionibacteriaceae bacterium]|nr:iron ABC transporter permease [Propionibacteriaceae bacterium]
MTALAQPVRAGRSLYLLAVPVALLGLVPVGFIVAESVGLGWADLRVAVLRPRVAELLGNTLTLSVLCVLGCLVIGLGMAWLVERSDLPGRRVWAALLVTPLAVPAFVNSYAWASLRPSFEGLSAAATITVLSYYPFVYLPVAAALRGLDRVLEESGAALGLGKLAVFVRVVLPQLRVALLGGALLVALHILAEFGALQMIGYETFTTVILMQYQSTFNGSAATTLAGVLVMCCLLFLTLEVLARGRVRYARVGPGAAGPVPPVRLGSLGWPSVIVVVALLVAAVGVPVFAIAQWWSSDVAVGAELMPALRSTVGLGLGGAAITTAAGLPLAWLAVRRRGPVSTLLERVTYLTSSLPGVVVALALVTVAARWLNPLYQTTALVVAAYVILFLPRALVNLRTGIGQTAPELDDSARALGASSLRRALRITLPLIAPGLASASAFVFLAVCTELTATLLLAPTGTTTLATRFWSHSESLDYAAAAPYAAAMILLAAPLTYLMLEQSRKVRQR